MGCGGSKEKLEGVDRPLDHWMEKVGIPDIDDKFYPLSDTIKDLENIRETVVDKRDEMHELSGSCAYKAPSLYKAGTSVLWKLSVDNKGEISKAGIDVIDKEPYITVVGSDNSKEGADAARSFITYCNSIKKIGSDFESVGENLKQLGEKATANQESTIEQIKSKLSNDPLAM